MASKSLRVQSLQSLGEIVHCLAFALLPAVKLSLRERLQFYRADSLDQRIPSIGIRISLRFAQSLKLAQRASGKVSFELQQPVLFRPVSQLGSILKVAHECSQALIIVPLFVGKRR